MTTHEKRQGTALSLIMALFDMMKRCEPPGTFRYRKLAMFERDACNLVNDWRHDAFEDDDLQHAGDVCDLVELELNRRFKDELSFSDQEQC